MPKKMKITPKLKVNFKDEDDPKNDNNPKNKDNTKNNNKFEYDPTNGEGPKNEVVLNNELLLSSLDESPSLSLDKSSRLVDFQSPQLLNSLVLLNLGLNNSKSVNLEMVLFLRLWT